jgi:hypothetical protein
MDWRYYSIYSYPLHCLELSAQPNDPAALPQRKIHDTHWIGGCVVPRTCLLFEKLYIPYHAEILTLDHPACSIVLHWLLYPGSLLLNDEFKRIWKEAFWDSILAVFWNVCVKPKYTRTGFELGAPRMQVRNVFSWAHLPRSYGRNNWRTCTIIQMFNSVSTKTKTLIVRQYNPSDLS